MQWSLGVGVEQNWRSCIYFQKTEMFGQFQDLITVDICNLSSKLWWYFKSLIVCWIFIHFALDFTNLFSWCCAIILYCLHYCKKILFYSPIYTGRTDLSKGTWIWPTQGCTKFFYKERNLSGKYWPYYLRPENTGHIISDWKILALDITISEINLIKKVFQTSNFNLYVL